MDAQKVFVTRDMEAVITCPHCDSVSKKPVSCFQEGQHAVDFCCDCGNKFQIRFDYRSRFRRELFGIHGTFVVCPPGIEWMSMTVKNISLDGVAIRSSFCRRLNIGDTVRMRFVFDVAENSELDAEAQVRHITGELAGCRFVNKDFFSRQLGCYLM